jgi:hypothetical protein
MEAAGTGSRRGADEKPDLEQEEVANQIVPPQPFQFVGSLSHSLQLRSFSLVVFGHSTTYWRFTSFGSPSGSSNFRQRDGGIYCSLCLAMLLEVVRIRARISEMSYFSNNETYTI